MPWLRVYVDRKITASGGGDNVRVIDIEMDEGDYTLGVTPNDSGVVYLTDTGREKLALEKDEEANDAAVLSFGEPV